MTVGAPLVDLWPKLLSCRQIDAVDAQLASALELKAGQHVSVGLVTCDQDDALYVALDHCTKFADVDVTFGRSFYAGSRHASGPFLRGSPGQRSTAGTTVKRRRNTRRRSSER